MSKLDEAGFGDFAKRWDAKLLGALGDKSAQGRRDFFVAKKAIEDDLKIFKGKTNRNSSPSTLIDFLVKKVGFTVNNVKNFLADAGVSFDRQDNDELPAGKIDKIITVATQFALENDLIDFKQNDKSSTKKKQRRDDDERYRSSRDGRSSRGSRKSSSNDLSDELDKISRVASGEKLSKKDAEVNDDAFSFSKSEYTNMLKKTGLTAEHMEDLVDIIDNSKSFKDVLKAPDSVELTRQLAAIGYAIFKAMEKK